MAFTITTPPENNITVNETTQTVNVTSSTNTITVQTSGITPGTSYDQDLNTTDDVKFNSITIGGGDPGMSDVIIPVASINMEGDGLKLRAGLLDQGLYLSDQFGDAYLDGSFTSTGLFTDATDPDDRAKFQYNASNAGSNSAIVLRKNYGATNFANGDGIGIRFEVDSNAQSSTEFAILHAQYGPSQPAFVFATSTDNAATAYQNALVVRADKTTVYGDLQVNGNTIYDSAGKRAIDLQTYTSGYGTTAYRLRLNQDVPYGIQGSFLVVDNIIEHNSSSLTTTSTDTAVLDYWPVASVRSAKYLVQITNGTAHQMWEGMVIHDGTNIYLSAYGDIRTNGNLATMSVGFSATGNPELRVTPVNATQTKFKAAKTLIYV